MQGAFVWVLTRIPRLEAVKKGAVGCALRVL